MQRVNKTVKNQKLQTERLKRKWSQRELAEKLETTVASVKRWERNATKPSPYFLLKLTETFKKSADELGFEHNDYQSSEPQIDLDAPQGIQQELPYNAHYNQTLSIWHSQPSHLFGRDEILNDLTVKLCHTNGSASALTGLPGVGKTALAIALAYHPRIQRQFEDGILWINLGERPQIQEVMMYCSQHLGLTKAPMEHVTTLDTLANFLHEQIGQRRILFILDNVWNVTDALAFKLGGPNCTYLLTTRFPKIAFSFAREQTFHLLELSEEDSFTLFTHLAPQATCDFHEEVYDLIKLVGGLPLALTLIGNYLHLQTMYKQPRRLHTAVERLRQHEEQRMLLTEPQVPWEQVPSVPFGTAVSLQSAIQMSEQLLPPEAQEALYALSIFPTKPDSFPEEAALYIGNMSNDMLDILIDNGLVESAQPGRYQIHQTISDYARLKYSNHAAKTRLVVFTRDFIQNHQYDDDRLERELPTIFRALEYALHDQYVQELIQIMEFFSPYLERRQLCDIIAWWLNQTKEVALSIHEPEQTIRIQIALDKLSEMNYRCEVGKKKHDILHD